jgi:integrase
MTDNAIRQMIDRRTGDAGIPHINPHRFRRTFAHKWLADGGQETDLMRLAGWRSREMVGRYGACRRRASTSRTPTSSHR